MSSYYDSAEGQDIPRKRALSELSKHGVPESETQDFFDTVGDRETYDAQAVLRWLGY